MEKNNFEKDISASLSNLQIVPGKEIWDKVELRIKKGKKTRWAFWIFTSSVIFLSGIAAFILFTQNSYIAKKDDGKTEISNLNLLKTKEQIRIDKKSEQRASMETKHLKNGSNVQEPHVAVTYFKNIVPLKIANRNSMNYERDNRDISFLFQKNDGHGNDTNTESKPGIKPDTLNRASTEISENVDSSNLTGLNNNRETSTKNTVETTTKSKVGIQPKPLKIKQGLQAEFAIIPGILSINATILATSGKSEASYAYSSTNSNLINRTVTYSFRRTYSYMVSGSLIKPVKNFAFMAGFVFRKYTISSIINEQNDSSGTVLSIKNRTETNNLNFLGLKTGMLIKTGKLLSEPLEFEGGFDLSKCFQKDSTIYSKTGKLYVNINAGADLSFLLSKNSVVRIGPFVSYNVNSISDYAPLKNKHFSFFGIKASVIFNSLHKPAKAKS